MIINIQHFDDFTTDPALNTEKFYALWRQIAAHYAGRPNGLAFELLNEPKDKATTETINPIYAEAIRIIRKTNPNRTIFLGPSRWNSLDEVPKLKLPDDNNLIVTVHSYEPFNFTHQGASWTGTSVSTTGIRYPGPPEKPLQPDAKALAAKPSLAKWFEDYNQQPTANNPCGPKAFAGRMERVAAWAKEHHRPIHLGEFGAYDKADLESRVRFYADVRQTAERLGWGWAIWDWRAGFKYWDGEKPVQGMHEALFGTK
jgi:endoglucanase